MASASSCVLLEAGEKHPEEGGGGRAWLTRLEGLIWFSVFCECAATERSEDPKQLQLKRKDTPLILITMC